MLIYLLVGFDDLTSLDLIAGSAADPAADGSDLGVHRWVVGATSTHTPGGDAIDGAANAQGAARVTVAGSLGAVVDTDHEGAVEAAAPSAGALSVRDDGDGVNALQGGGQTAASACASPSGDGAIAAWVAGA